MLIYRKGKEFTKHKQNDLIFGIKQEPVSLTSERFHQVHYYPDFDNLSLRNRVAWNLIRP